MTPIKRLYLAVIIVAVAFAIGLLLAKLGPIAVGIITERR